MPYDWRKSGNGFEVFNEDTGKTVPGGYHADKKKALAHMRALYANVEDAADKHKEKTK